MKHNKQNIEYSNLCTHKALVNSNVVPKIGRTPTQPLTLNPQPSTFYPLPSTFNLLPSTFYILNF